MYLEWSGFAHKLLCIGQAWTGSPTPELQTVSATPQKYQAWSFSMVFNRGGSTSHLLSTLASRRLCQHLVMSSAQQINHSMVITQISRHAPLKLRAFTQHNNTRYEFSSDLWSQWSTTVLALCFQNCYRYLINILGSIINCFPITHASRVMNALITSTDKHIYTDLAADTMWNTRGLL